MIVAAKQFMVFHDRGQFIERADILTALLSIIIKRVNIYLLSIIEI